MIYDLLVGIACVVPAFIVILAVSVFFGKLGEKFSKYKNIK